MSDELRRYSAGAILLHWVTALLIVPLSILGLVHDALPKQTQAFWIDVHAVIGLFLWLLTLVRLGWRAAHPPPTFPSQLGSRARHLATAAHFLLYMLLLIAPVLGVVTFLYHGRILDLGLVQFHSGIQPNRAIFHPTQEFHAYLAYALWGLTGVHA